MPLLLKVESRRRMLQSKYGEPTGQPSLASLTAKSRCVDKPGLLLKSQGEDLTIGQGPFARDDKEWQGKDHGDLLSVIKEVKPHVLIGTSTKPKAFTADVVKEMSKHVDRPIILPLSNPIRLHEADPKDISEWSKGKALIATGSPFPPVEYEGRKYEVGELARLVPLPGDLRAHFLGEKSRNCPDPYLDVWMRSEHNREYSMLESVGLSE